LLCKKATAKMGASSSTTWKAGRMEDERGRLSLFEKGISTARNYGTECSLFINEEFQ
jgi:hypothetical protein